MHHHDLCHGFTAHARLHPTPHRFRYRVSFLAVDLAHLDELNRIAAVGHNRFRPIALHDRDFLGPGAAPLDRGFARLFPQLSAERILLVTFPRVWHYAFRPVSFYLGLDGDDSLRWAVAEVNNTFGDRHVYPVPLRRAGTGWEGWHAKEFHVSPFNDMQGRYHFRFQLTAGEIRAEVDLHAGERCLLKTSLHGRRSPLTHASALRFLALHPLRTALTVPRILVQAGLLHWRRRLPAHPRPDPRHPRTLLRRKRLPGGEEVL